MGSVGTGGNAEMLLHRVLARQRIMPLILFVLFVDSDLFHDRQCITSVNNLPAYILCVDSKMLVSVFAMPGIRRMRPSTALKASRLSARSSAMMSQRPLVVCKV